MRKNEKIFKKVLTNQHFYDKIQIVKVIFIEFETDFHYFVFLHRIVAEK